MPKNKPKKNNSGQQTEQQEYFKLPRFQNDWNTHQSVVGHDKHNPHLQIVSRGSFLKSDNIANGKLDMTCPMLVTDTPASIGLNIDFGQYKDIPNHQGKAVATLLEKIKKNIIIGGGNAKYKNIKVKVVEVMIQEFYKKEWSLEDLKGHFEKAQKDRKEIINQTSWEISNIEELKRCIQIPEFVRDMDWVTTLTPDEVKISGSYISIEKYIVTSAGLAYMDFHMDFSGTSVWYHIYSGSKLFCLIKPTEEVIQSFVEWYNSELDVHFIDRLLKDLKESLVNLVINGIVMFVEVNEGQTIIIPGGWIHAVYTPNDSVAIGGNFLHGFAIKTQIDCDAADAETGTAGSFRFGNFAEVHLYAAQHYMIEMQKFLQLQHGNDVPFHHLPVKVVEGLPHLIQFVEDICTKTSKHDKHTPQIKAALRHVSKITSKDVDGAGKKRNKSIDYVVLSNAFLEELTTTYGQFMTMYHQKFMNLYNVLFQENQYFGGVASSGRVEKVDNRKRPPPSNNSKVASSGRHVKKVNKKKKPTTTNESRNKRPSEFTGLFQNYVENYSYAVGNREKVPETIKVKESDEFPLQNFIVKGIHPFVNDALVPMENNNNNDDDDLIECLAVYKVPSINMVHTVEDASRKYIPCLKKHEPLKGGAFAINHQGIEIRHVLRQREQDYKTIEFNNLTVYNTIAEKSDAGCCFFASITQNDVAQTKLLKLLAWVPSFAQSEANRDMDGVWNPYVQAMDTKFYIDTYHKNDTSKQCHACQAFNYFGTWKKTNNEGGTEATTVYEFDVEDDGFKSILNKMCKQIERTTTTIKIPSVLKEETELYVAVCNGINYCSPISPHIGSSICYATMTCYSPNVVENDIHVYNICFPHYGIGGIAIPLHNGGAIAYNPKEASCVSNPMVGNAYIVNVLFSTSPFDEKMKKGMNQKNAFCIPPTRLVKNDSKKNQNNKK